MRRRSAHAGHSLAPAVPTQSGHCIVVPFEHHRGLHDLPERLYVQLLKTVRVVSAAVMRAFSADGTSVLQHNEAPG
ncbi:MAG: HIT domain-containing protein [Chloroflexi bacterium]|nr:HIT domain-containing protein [Chloroflexota bacterium]MBV9598197.1 HIT domain-containing protein [Chloroflexota bacterium]